MRDALVNSCAAPAGNAFLATLRRCSPSDNASQRAWPRTVTSVSGAMPWTSIGAVRTVEAVRGPVQGVVADDQGITVPRAHSAVHDARPPPRLTTQQPPAPGPAATPGLWEEARPPAAGGRRLAARGQRLSTERGTGLPRRSLGGGDGPPARPKGFLLTLSHKTNRTRHLAHGRSPGARRGPRTSQVSLLVTRKRPRVPRAATIAPAWPISLSNSASLWDPPRAGGAGVPYLTYPPACVAAVSWK